MAGVTFDNTLNRGSSPGLMNASLAGVPFRLNPDSVSLAFNVKTSTTPTVGGLVIQVFGVEFSDLVVTGSFGTGGWREQAAFLQRILQLAKNQSSNQPLAAPPPQPVRFLFPSRGYDFLVYLKAYASKDGMAVVHDNQIINPSWQLTMFIETESAPGALKKIATDSYIDRLSTGLGYVINDFNGPQTQAEVNAFVQSQPGGFTNVQDYINSPAFGGPVQTPNPTNGASGTSNTVLAPVPIPGDVQVTNITDYINAVLSALGAPTTQANITSMTNWAAKESKFGSGGPDDPLVTHNPFNCTVPMTGSHGINSVNVQAYVTWRDGVQAMVDTLTGARHYYDDIVAALGAGNGLGSGHYNGLLKWSGNGYDHI